MRILSLLAATALIAATPAAAEPAMWRIADADTQITLFGSIHALPPATQWYSPRIAAAFDGADRLVLETVVPDDPAALAPLVTTLGIRPGLPPLASRIAPSKRATLLASVAALGLQPRRLDGMETWLAAIALGDGAVAQIGLTPAAGVEATLSARAKAAGKPIVGLETPEAQLRMFDGLGETDQRALLDATVANLASVRADTNALLAYWQAGQTEALAADFAKQLNATPGLRTALLTSRNAAWTDWLVTSLQRPGKTFVAVGAGHLGGSDSVIAMLRARGVAVERLP